MRGQIQIILLNSLAFLKVLFLSGRLSSSIFQNDLRFFAKFGGLPLLRLSNSLSFLEKKSSVDNLFLYTGDLYFLFFERIYNFFGYSYDSAYYNKIITVEVNLQ